MKPDQIHTEETAPYRTAASVIDRRLFLIQGTLYGLIAMIGDNKQPDEAEGTPLTDTPVRLIDNYTIVENGQSVHYAIDQYAKGDTIIHANDRSYKNVIGLDPEIAKLCSFESAYEDEEGIHAVTNIGEIIIKKNDFHTILSTLAFYDIPAPTFEVYIYTKLDPMYNIIVQAALNVANINLSEKQKIALLRINNKTNNAIA